MPLKIADSLKHEDFKPCILCNKGMMHERSITFFRLTLERHLIDVNAVQRAHGMELMMGGNAKLANIMGPNEALAKQIDTNTVLICEPCAIRHETRLFEIYEKATSPRAASCAEMTAPELAFTNELGNAISMSVRVQQGAVLIDISGPSSHTQIQLTPHEAGQLCAMLPPALAERRCVCGHPSSQHNHRGCLEPGCYHNFQHEPGIGEV